MTASVSESEGASERERKGGAGEREGERIVQKDSDHEASAS